MHIFGSNFDTAQMGRLRPALRRLHRITAALGLLVMLWSALPQLALGAPPPAGGSTSPATEPSTAGGGNSSTAENKPMEVNSMEVDPAATNAAEQMQKDLGIKAADHLYLAHKYAFRWDFDLAEVEFQEAISYMPELRVVHRDYCLLAIAKGKPSLALAEFMLATGIGDPIPYTEQEIAQLNAKAAKLHYQKAISYANLKRWATAISELELANKYAPANANVKRSLAFAYANAGKFDLAEQSYKETFALSPADGFSHADFAFLLSQEGKQDPAVNQMAKAVEVQPQSAALHVDLAWFAENKGDIEKAGNELRDAIKLSPNHAGLWTHLGRLQEKLDKISEAKQAYKQALAIDPSQAEAKSALSKLTDASGSNPAE